MTTTFYAPPDHFSDGLVRLPDDEARHAVRVLRHAPGDLIEVVDGEGGWHRVELTEVNKQRAEGRVIETERGVGEPTCHLTVALGTLKNAGRFETFAEKAVELGVSEIVPLVTERTERMSLKRTRLENILIAAMKQSGRSRLPVVTESTSLKAILEAADNQLGILCHEAADPESLLPRVLDRAPTSDRIVVLVGPEGGFSDAEVEAAKAVGWTVASLGPRRLRAETAAIVAAATVMLAASQQVEGER